MKKLMLLVLTFVSAKAFALTPHDGYYVCGRIQDSSIKSQCVSIVARSYIDEYAAGACDRIPGSQDTLNCIQTIANKNYDPRAVQSCDSISGVQETINCLNSVGRPRHGGGGGGNYPNPPPSGNLRQWVKESARYSLRQLDRGNLEEVRRQLEEMARL